MSLYEDITGKKYVEPSKKELQTIPDWMKNSQPQKKKKNKIIKKSSYLEDGYDFGDITKTILSTTGDLATNVSKGFMNTIEGTVDTARYAIGNATKNSAELQAKVWDFFGNEAYANELRKAGQNVKDYTYKNAQMNVTGALLGETNDLFQTNWSQKLNEGSAAGTLVNSVEQGIGNIGAFVGLAGIGGLAANGAGALGASTTTTNALTSLTSSNASTFVNSFTSAFGNSMSNALNSGLDEKEARGQAITSGLAEAISEQFFQGIPGLKSAGWADNLISKPIGKYFSGKTGKIALKVMDSVGEGLEEVISNVLQTTFEGIRTNKNVKDIFSELGDTIKSEETREAMISAFISSALTNGGGALITNNQKNQIIDSYAKEHDMSVKETKQLFDSLVEKKANLEETSNYKERVDLEENISKQLVKDLKADNKIDLNELFKQTPNSLKEMQFRFNQEEAKNVRTEKQNILANDMARLNDEKSNHELYKVVNAIQSANDTQQYHITTTEGLYEMGIVKKNSKGEYVMPDGSPYVPRGLNYKNGEIYINADVGSKSGTQAVYHEMFEGFKKAAPEQYNEFKQMVTDIIGEENIQKEFDTYKSMYGEELTDDIRDEIINDKFGELAENQNFINKIADNRNVLERLIDSVKNMIKYVKGTPEEKEFIKLQNKLEKEFAKRYKETDFSKSEGDTAYSLKESKAMLEKQFKEMTGDSLLVAEAKLGNYAFQQIRGNQVEAPYNQEAMDLLEKIQNSKKTSSHLYHSTPADRIQSIAKNGLVVGSKQNQEGVSSTNKLYLSATEELADSFTPEDSVMLRISPNAKLENLDNDLLGGEGSYTITNNIEPKYLQVKENGKWIPLLKSKYANETTYSLTTNKDSNGRDLTPQQQEYFKDSKVVDDEGNLKVVYHGSKRYGHTTFENQENGYYFTDDKSGAETYIDINDKKHGTYETYLNITNPYIFDAEGRNWNNLVIGNDTAVEQMYNSLTNQEKNYLSDLADRTDNLYDDYREGMTNFYQRLNAENEELYDKVANYSGIREKLYAASLYGWADTYVKDLIGERYTTDKIVDMVLEENKNGANYDGIIFKNIVDEGMYAKEVSGKATTDYVVFNSNQIKNVDNTNPTSNEDIRYSLTTNKDSNGKTLTKEQQEYFKNSKVVDEKGNLLTIYRAGYEQGTDNVKGFFTNDKNAAKYYKNYFERDKWGGEGQIYEVYMNLENPLIVDAEGNWYQEVPFEGEELWTDDIVDIAKERGYDGVIFKNVAEGDDWGGFVIDDYVSFNPNQVKNIDNTNPTTDPDIRYSLAPVSEKTNRAKEEIGTTTDLREAGYLTADGEYLDFSGKKHGGQPGRRSMDHREIADIYTDEEYDNAESKYSNLGTATAIMQDFIEEGNIRLMPEQGIDISIEPTDAQYDKLADYIDFVKDRNGEIYIDVDKTGTGNYGSTYYSSNTPTSKIIRDIKEYFKTGTYPEQSDMSQFYSLTKNDNIDSKEIAPIGTTTDEMIAPIREDISNLSNQLNNLSNQIQTLQNGAETVSNNEIAPVNPYRARAIAQREANQRAEEMYKDENYWKSLEEIANQASDLDEKSVRKMSRNIGKELGLKQKQIKDLQGIIQKSFDKGYSLQDIKNELDKQFGHQTVSERLDEVIDAQRELRNIKIKVSPEIQRDIADYGYWKQQYFGKIRFSNDGSPVDVAYAQLSERNPSMYPSDIINPTDQLLRIAEVADMDRKYTIDYEMDRNTIDEAANYINDTIQETLYANAMKSQTDLEKNAMQYNERTKDIPVKKKTRAETTEELQSRMGITVDDLQVGNDIKSMSYNLTTPERVNEKVFGREVGRKINEQTVFFAKHQEAERIRFLNRELKEIADLGIKARSKESALVQQYGEGLLDDVQLAQAVSDKATQEKIKNAARVLRSKYDTYLDQINEELVEMGYDPIPKRKDYMRHFQELTDKFSQAGIPFNRQALNAENLPTDINGLTEFNVPGKNWFASAQRRTGEKTTYDAITGIDGYLQGASNLMYHTETIQRYRALEKLIRDTYGQTHGLDVFGDDLSSEQAMQRITDIQEGKLSNYAAWLKEQGNALAGKKGALDRGFERALGRRAYTLASELKKQVGSNMTGFNVRSALTNFISSTIAASKTNKLAMVKGTVDTIRNMFNDDGFIDRSDFLTSRLRGDTSISKKTWQKISNAGQILMSGSDWFTSNLITRSKYYEGIQKGMTEDQAMNYANDFAARVMGDRSKGATAEAFNSKTLGFLTQFQLETNNQWQYFIHDTKMEYQENLAKDGGLKAGATVLFQVGQLAAYSYLFNEMFEQLTGSRAAFDILDIIKKLFGLDDDDKDKTFEERMKEAGSELVDALPFASLFGSGGRLPIGEMLTPAQTLYDYITGGTNKYGQDITLKDVSKDALESIPYYVLPTGYGQIKKTAQGLGMYTNKVPGSYTDSGNLRFTADEDTGSVIKNALFGQWSGEEAKKYRESGYSTINAKDIPLMRDLDMSSSEFRDFKKNMSEETETSKKVDGTTYSKYFDEDGNTYWYDKDTRTVYDNDMNETDISVLSLEKANASELKFNYVSNLPISEDNKQKLFDELFSNTTTDKYGYKKYTDSKNKTYWYDEDNDILYNSKYDKVDADDVDGLTEVSESKDMANYKDYGSYAEFDYAYKNPAKYKTMKAIAGYDDYQKYKAELTTIRDNTKNDKEETFEYINSLDLTIPQKAMFLRQYYSTYRRYNNEIVNYVNSLDIDYEDKVEILESLKMKVDSKGNVSWK